MLLIIKLDNTLLSFKNSLSRKWIETFLLCSQFKVMRASSFIHLVYCSRSLGKISLQGKKKDLCVCERYVWFEGHTRTHHLVCFISICQSDWFSPVKTQMAERWREGSVSVGVGDLVWFGRGETTDRGKREEDCNITLWSDGQKFSSGLDFMPFQERQRVRGKKSGFFYFYSLYCMKVIFLKIDMFDLCTHHVREGVCVCVCV